ncbi:U-box domain-containing protein 35-like [Mercurialis annua]|uniref:U-box domain-containing protein 35-like n=1 Tax=Mercurialis annua TaxID=3986 RepID=UPI00215FBD9C|nr:U-box domain-containing protein 35-like [Mercurialis annua]
MAYFRSELKADEDHGLTAIAIDADKNSQAAVKWAVDNLVNNKHPQCILVHVQCKSLAFGDNAGNVPKEGRPPTQQELQQFFLPYRGFCARRGIETKEVVIHDIDVPSALNDYIVNNNVSNIVLGASHRNAIMRKFKHPDTPTTVLKTAPECSAVYVIAKGKVQTFRLATRPHTPTTNSNGSTHSSLRQHSPPTTISHASSLKQQHYDQSNLNSPRSPPSDSQVSYNESWKSEGSDKMSPDASTESILLKFHEKYGFSLKSKHTPKPSTDGLSLDMLRRDSLSDGSDYSSGPLSLLSADVSYENVDSPNYRSQSKNSNSSQLANLLDSEMRRLKLELQQSMELFTSVTKEAVLAKQMVRELHRLQTLETRKSSDEMDLVEGATLTLAEMEKQKKKVAFEALQAAKKLADLEAQKRKTEMRAQFEAEDKMKNEEMDNNFRCRRYSIDEIEIATDHFSPAHKIGEGGYGPVFKGMLNHIAVAIKILRPDLSQGQKQFRQEVDVLSSMRHPHMVILLGACPEYGCLVYEYMENGSLEDRLFRKDHTPPIPWRTRFKIAYEIATALVFLHETKPEPLVHRDLKPANILLDRNYTSKVSDVGLARLVPQTEVSQYHMTAAAGTFCYIDPEYQQTGLLGVKSDLYSFGVVLLQLLTARPAMGLSYQVEDSIEKGTFSKILDPALEDWPVEDCLSLAKMSINCCELRKKDRPDLGTVVLPELFRLSNLGMDVATERIQHETTIPLTTPSDLDSEAQSHSDEVSYYFRKMNVHL